MGLRFWAQALDNRSADHEQVDGQLLADDAPNRSDVIDAMAHVTRLADPVSLGRNVRYFLRAPEFVLEAAPVARDEAGRKSPIQCHGVVDGESEDWVEEVLSEFLKFAERADREFDEATLAEARQALGEIKKKTQSLWWTRAASQFPPRSRWLVALIAAALLLGLLSSRECGDSAWEGEQPLETVSPSHP